MAFEGELKFSGTDEECKQDAIMVITGLIEQWDIEREDLDHCL